MFSIFKKKLDDSIMQFIGTESSFTYKQKLSILKSLTIIAYADKEFNDKEVNLLEVIAKELNQEFSNTLVDDINNLNKYDSLAEIVKFNQGQKEWFLEVSLRMIYVDGKFSESEYKEADFMFRAMEIDIDTIKRKQLKVLNS